MRMNDQEGAQFAFEQMTRQNNKNRGIKAALLRKHMGNKVDNTLSAVVQLLSECAYIQYLE